MLITPASNPAELRAAIARLPPFVARGFAGRPGHLVLRRLDGLTNTSYAVTAGSETFVVRFAGEGTAEYIDRAQELSNHTTAAALGIAPMVEYCDVRDGTLVTCFIEGAKPLAASDLREPAVLEAVTDLLARLHNAGCEFRGRRDLFATLDRYIELAGGCAAPDLKTLLQLERLAGDRAREHRLDARPLRACHIDPAPSNFLRLPGDGVRLLLIDWEYASMCDPLWDLADLSLEGQFVSWQDEVMMARYTGEIVRDEDRRYLRLYKGLLALLAAVWAGARLAQANDAAVREQLSTRLAAGFALARDLLSA
ncbi:MAG: phosphotransferase [Gammaproteobacteria bacterium]